jgi:hypothetical protein
MVVSCSTGEGVVSTYRLLEVVRELPAAAKHASLLPDGRQPLETARRVFGSEWWLTLHTSIDRRACHCASAGDTYLRAVFSSADLARCFTALGSTACERAGCGR